MPNNCDCAGHIMTDGRHQSVVDANAAVDTLRARLAALDARRRYHPDRTSFNAERDILFAMLALATARSHRARHRAIIGGSI